MDSVREQEEAALAAARTQRYEAQQCSMQWQRAFQRLLRRAGPDAETGEDFNPRLTLAQIGIKLASTKMDAARLGRQVVSMERKTGILSFQVAEERLRDLNRYSLCAGADLWRHQKTMLQNSLAGTSPSNYLAGLYTGDHGTTSTKDSSPPGWRSNVLTYYGGECALGGVYHVWCHISGMWQPEEITIRAAPIVPFSAPMADGVDGILFGRQEAPGTSSLLHRGRNALLMSSRIKQWFENYHLVVVPVDATENPITRWRTEILSPSILQTEFCPGHDASSLYGKELVFRNGRRPAVRYLYFHFVMALVRFKDLRRLGWQDVWARYHQQRPFPTPERYIRQSILLALATHFGPADMNVVESWMADYGFESPLTLSGDEATEAARRIHLAVESAACRGDEEARLGWDTWELEDGGDEDTDSDADTGM